ncbi:MAG: succinyl-diaminopimelate desuccinylase [Microbacteriaceae bacterium]|jgi:succinyl-diaminopimelate desuccinylase
MSAPELDVSRDVATIAQAVCDIESVSGNEGRLADAIEHVLRGASHLRVLRDGDALVARTELGRAQRVLIAGHIDTVPVNSNLPVRREQRAGVEVLVGRGTVDMKSGIAVMLKIASEVRDPSVDVTWVFYDHEEVSSSLNGLGRLARNLPDIFDADFGILCEPTNAVVEGGCNGTLRVDVRARGTRAHSARAWKGDNAIHKLGSALTRLSEFGAATVTVDGLDYRESLSAVGVSGGVAGNVIPDEAVLSVNYRFAPATTVEQAREFLEAFFAGFEVTVTDAAPGARPGLDTPVAQDFIAAVGVAPAPKFGWTDVSRLAEMGIPAVNFGPGDPSLAHADDEHVAVDQIVTLERMLRGWLTR